MSEPLPEQVEPSRAWLAALPQHTQSWASNLFLTAIRAGHTEPRAVCRHVALAVKARGKEARAADDAQSLDKLACIWRHLMGKPLLALSFAAERLQWESLSDEEKARRKAANAERYREQWREGRASQSRGGRT